MNTIAPHIRHNDPGEIVNVVLDAVVAICNQRALEALAMNHPIEYRTCIQIRDEVQSMRSKN